MEEYERGCESIRGEEERRTKGSQNNHELPKFPKSPNHHLLNVCLVKDPNHQSLNVGGGWLKSPTSIVMRAWGLSTSQEECKRLRLHKYLKLTDIQKSFLLSCPTFMQF